MIELNVDLSYLSKYFDIGTQRINQYANKNIEDVMEQEANSGNAAAANYQSVIRDPAQVAKIFRLMDPVNRFLIIQNLSQNDLNDLLQYLEKDDLIWGLKYFTQDKLLALINELPKEQLMSVVFENFTMEDVLKLMPEDEMDKFFKNDKVEKTDVMKYFESLDAEQLQRIMVNQFGIEMQQESKKDLIGFLKGMDPNKFGEFLTKMERKDKIGLIINLTENKPKLIQEFDNESLSRPMHTLEKPDIIKNLKVLDNEFIQKMIEELPPDLIQVIATQIDPAVFSDILVDKYPDVLSQIAM